MSDNIDELLGIDMSDPRARLAHDLVQDTFGILEKLVAIRKQRGLSQAAVAERLGWSVEAVGLFESVSADPCLSSIRRYALAVWTSLRTEVKPADA